MKNIGNINNKNIGALLNSSNIYYEGGGKTLDRMIYPIGSIYLSVNSTNPHELFGRTWVQIKDKFLLACGDTYDNGSTGGSENVTLTSSQLPNHKHLFANGSGGYVLPTVDRILGTTWGATYSEGGGYKINTATDQKMEGTTGQPHNNMPPYLTVYMWYRTA